MAQIPREGWLTANGLNLHYRDWGGSGPPIVLLHGLASTSHIWDLVAPPAGGGLCGIGPRPAGPRGKRQAGVRL